MCNGIYYNRTSSSKFLDTGRNLCNRYRLLEGANFSTSSTATTSRRPFKILGLQQVAIGSTDINSLRRLWLDIFGLEKIGEYSSQKENVIEDILKLGDDDGTSSKNGSVPVEVDLMCPMDEERSPKVGKMLCLKMWKHACR
jgi:hypothetical protein